MSNNLLIDHFCIWSPGGVVLWETESNKTSPFDSLISQKMIYQAGTTSLENEALTIDIASHSVSWLVDNANGLIFAVAYPRILSLAYIPTLLQTIKTLFISLFSDAISYLTKVLNGSLSYEDCPPAFKKRFFAETGSNPWTWKGWEDTFVNVCRELEAEHRVTKSRIATTTTSVNTEQRPKATAHADEPSAPDAADMIARNIAAFKNKRVASSARKKTLSAPVTPLDSGSDTDVSPATPTGKKAAHKTLRKWEGSKATKEEMAALDFSPSSTPSRATTTTKNLVEQSSLGSVDQASGIYSVADFGRTTADGDDDDEDWSMPESADSSHNGTTGLFSRLTSLMSSSGSTGKVLTQEELQPVVNTLQNQLLTKNVAQEVAESISVSVLQSLLGSKLSKSSMFSTSSSSLNKAVKKSMNEALTRILTPKTSTDLLLEIQKKRQQHTMAQKVANHEDGTSDPYVMTFVGVNGVGKSTNLSKIAYWLLQNKLRVMIAACDTFRSGAVEQLRVHVNNLKQLSGSDDAVQSIELYEKGYGKDSAGIAKEAIAYAAQSGYDVVLVDTAGRMQDNEPLMRALAKLVAVNKPDKIVFVGEALVGNEAVDQLTKFNSSLRDFTASTSAGRRGIDGIILTKFDTIDDKVGAAVSMTFVTGQPLLFVGTGQTYSDIRTLRVESIVNALLA